MNATLVSIFILCASCIFLARRVGKLEKLCVDPKLLEDLEAKRAEVAKAQKEVEEKLEHALELQPGLRIASVQKPTAWRTVCIRLDWLYV